MINIPGPWANRQTEDTRPRVITGTLAIEERISRRPKGRRTRQALNAEFGHALTLKGAVKKAKLKKLANLATQVPGYQIPWDASEVLNSYAPKAKVTAVPTTTE